LELARVKEGLGRALNWRMLDQCKVISYVFTRCCLQMSR